ncbi:MAG: DUF916 domain-containing protein [Omnitrophica bacterium]|nr:DUF916 domain-containing protein [Candidatus Omnitrophota bacterium]
MKRTFSVLFFCLLLSLSANAFSFNLSIDVPKVKLKVKAGEIIRGSLTVRNPSEDEIKVKVYAEDFSYIAPYNGAKKFFPPGSTEFSLAHWITFSPQEIILPAFGKKKVNYAIKVPAEVSGGYYAVLFFETSLGAITSPEEGANILILGRVGSLFFLEAEDSLKKAKIEKIATEGNTVKGDFLNRGNLIIISKGSFYVMDDQGMIFDRGKINDIYISPGDKAPFSLTLADDISPGSYTLITSFDLEEGDLLVREIDFSKDATGELKILQVRE